MVDFNLQIGAEKPESTGSHGITFAPQISFAASISGAPQRTWQRKWRDVMNARTALADIYQGSGFNQDGFTTAIEVFFKTCRELADWIDEQEPSVDAKRYVNTEQSLKICDGLAQTAKHHTRDGKDPITAHVDKMFSDRHGIHADIVWNNNAGNGTLDALKLADHCIAEWEQFFQQHSLDPAS